MSDARRLVDHAHSRGFGWAFLSGVLLCLSLGAGAVQAAEPGEQIYAEKCASCHGVSGEGVRGEFSSHLSGDMSLAKLGSYIERWMPEEDPDEVVGEEAEQVARYVYDAFYSPIAQARNRPARVELSRLTAEQYRHAVADVVASFRSPSASGDDRGLQAQYFNARRPGGDRVAERTDEQVQFEFVGGGEVAEGLDSVGFSARWRGSLIAPETGTYEMIVRTNHGFRLWVNGTETPLIDGWVVSRNETEHRASIFLIGGRRYPLRLDFTSRDQGVNKDDPDAKPVEGFLDLKWKKPKHVAEVIPSRYLSPKGSQEVLVVATPFPPEDRSVGYERGTSISKAWHRATTDAAIEVANYVSDNLTDLAGGSDDAEERQAKARAFAVQFVERAFRRPLNEAQQQLFVDQQFSTAPDLETAVKRVVLLALSSPRFLYLDFGSENPDSHEVATRLSFSLWDSVPDKQLREAADAGELASAEAVRRQADRMVDDPRTRHKMRQFFHHWLHLEHNADASKSDEVFPEFDEALVSDLRRSLDLFLEDVVWGDNPDFRELMRSNELYINGRLAAYYGFDLPADAPFQKVKADHPQRRGVVSHPYVMAVFAYHDTTSPIHRGVNLARGMLGRTLRPPPEAFTPDPADLHPEMTTRERVAEQTAPAACVSCHSLINPLGFTLENFDAVGRFREEEEGKPIDSSGGYELGSGELESFEDASDLAAYLAMSAEAREAFVLQLFHHLVKQPIRGYGQDKPAEMGDVFAEHDYHIRRIMAEIAATAALAGTQAESLTQASPSPSSDK
ncbi:MAG: DUF1592 domain-containing protein [Phycisphaeraceae bacterium]